MKYQVDYEALEKDIRNGCRYEELFTLDKMIRHFSSLSLTNGDKLIDEYRQMYLDKYDGRNRRRTGDMRPATA